MNIPFEELKTLAEKYNLSHIVMLAHQTNSNTDHIVIGIVIPLLVWRGCKRKQL